jgi:hypothetical protein
MEPETTETTADATAAADTPESKARALGWVPEDEWRSKDPPPGGFVSAEAFLERSPGHYSKDLKAEISNLRGELAEIKTSADSFRNFAQRAMERERRDKEDALRRLEARREQAITEGDGRQAVAAERQMAEIRQDLNRPDPQTPDPAAMRVVQDFIRDNAWYQDDPHMRAWAEGRSVGLLQAGVPAGKAVLDRVAQEAREVFPQKFQAQRAANVESGGRRTAAEFGRRSFDDLPADAKRAYDQYRKLMPTFTKAQFLEQYEWE